MFFVHRVRADNRSNTTDSAVRITHISTGLVVSQQDEKSQHKNKAKVLRILRSRFILKPSVNAKTVVRRKEMIGTGDRSERIVPITFRKPHYRSPVSV